jgi:hypothetical protein
MKKISPKQRERHIRYLRKLERRRKKKGISKRRRQQNRIQITSVDYAPQTLAFIGDQGFTTHPFFHTSSNHGYSIRIPKIFSLIDNVDETLLALESIAQAARDKRIRELYIDHSNCEKMDLGASTVMDVLIMAARKAWGHKKVHLHGAYPRNDQVSELLKITGIIKHIEHPDSRLPDKVKEKYKVFHLVFGKRTRRITPFKSTQAEIITSSLTEYFNSLLELKGFRLSENGMNNLSRLISEVLDNAEQHSGNDEWYVIGYMNQIDHSIGDCQICIFDFGTPINRSLMNADLNPQMRNGVENLISKHLEKGFFQIRDIWSEENLWTLYALQEGISRFNVRNKTTDRGHGTVNMVEFFLDLGISSNKEFPPRMALISGNTYILFDSSYKLGVKDLGDEKRQVIAFNAANSLEEKPDNRCVKKLHNYFPGTMITMNFFLDQKHLQSIKTGEIDNGNNNN